MKNNSNEVHLCTCVYVYCPKINTFVLRICVFCDVVYLSIICSCVENLFVHEKIFW